ncbi:hypothetical protein T484DRAFT_3633446 [Baffinella frigidus]|nr:hypothetical protein T484DRAFT_3633446 [Cryptophyta sp. CCMP2293]
MSRQGRQMAVFLARFAAIEKEQMLAVHENDIMCECPCFDESEWVFVPKSSGRRNPLCSDEMAADAEADETCTGFDARIDNPGDIRATSPRFAPIAAARRIKERGDAEKAAAARLEFEHGLYSGQHVDAVFPEPTTDGTFHFFPAIVVGLSGDGTSTYNSLWVMVQLKWPNAVGVPNKGTVPLRDVREQVPVLEDNSLAEGWSAEGWSSKQ